MGEREEVIREIAKACFLARRKWLNEHPEAALTDYGHAHGMMGHLEAGVAEGWGTEKDLEEGRALLLKKYGLDVGKLPE